MQIIFVEPVSAVSENSKLNIFSVTTKVARQGKSLLFNKVKNDGDWFNLKAALIKNNKTSANKFYETINRLDLEDIEKLAGKKQIYSRLLSEDIYLDTFDGFIQSGTFSGRVKYRVDMTRYSKEFLKYSDPYNFNFQKLIDQGISKQGFFTVDELDQALNIYVAKGLGEQINVNGIMKDKGEIIFVKKTDGTTILTPRLNGDGNDFPHPVLVKGDDVLNAGTIKPIGSKYVEITNKTGHYKVHKDDMLPIVEELKAKNYIVEFKEGN